jgi:hypothetical protein
MKENEKTFDSNILLQEFNQAWDHYRHLENVRTKYMNFFFTAVFAVFGLYTALFKVDQFNLDDFDLIIVLVLINTFSIFTLFVFINITRIGNVLDGYSNIIKRLRVLLYGKKKLIPEKISVREHLADKKTKFQSVQYSAETILKFSMFLMNLLSLIIITYNYNSFSKTIFIVVLILQLILFISEIIVIRKSSK